MSISSPEPVSGYQLDAENAAEMARLTKQARMLSTMLGLLPETVDLTRSSLVLDLGCGPGEWVLEMARRSPASLSPALILANS
jgi:tRNA G46 methylase TrmB